MKESWLQETIPTPSVQSRTQAEQRQTQLTKPIGSLGNLERLAVDFAGWQETPCGQLQQLTITVFAADHGIATEGVSAFPQQVTQEMIKNFSRGGAAISVLARQMKADFAVVNLGTVSPCAEMPHLVNLQIASGTKNLAVEPAMSNTELNAAIVAGRDHAPTRADLFIGGEMGIGNTTAAAALGCALLDLPANTLTGRGTGIDEAAWQRKCLLIEQALSLHGSHADNPLELLRRLGGLEIAALSAAYIACAQRKIPSLVDGFISTVAALVATRINPGVRQWMLFSHCSQEAGHDLILRALDAEPLLNLQLRLGEGSGAATAVPLLRSACLLHEQMATFAEAGISQV